jgi:hypothetical protein
VQKFVFTHKSSCGYQVTYPQSSEIPPFFNIEALAGPVPGQACWRFHFAKRFGSAVGVMPAAPVFVAQLLAGFFLSAKAACRFFDEGLADVVDREGQAKSVLSGLP